MQDNIIGTILLFIGSHSRLFLHLHTALYVFYWFWQILGDHNNCLALSTLLWHLNLFQTLFHPKQKGRVVTFSISLLKKGAYCNLYCLCMRVPVKVVLWVTISCLLLVQTGFRLLVLQGWSLFVFMNLMEGEDLGPPHAACSFIVQEALKIKLCFHLWCWVHWMTVVGSEKYNSII